MSYYRVFSDEDFDSFCREVISAKMIDYAVKNNYFDCKLPITGFETTNFTTEEQARNNLAIAGIKILDCYVEEETEIGSMLVVNFEREIYLTPYEVAAILHLVNLPKQDHLLILSHEYDIYARIFLILTKLNPEIRSFLEKEMVDKNEKYMGRIYVTGPSTLTKALLFRNDYIRKIVRRKILPKLVVDDETISNAIYTAYTPFKEVSGKLQLKLKSEIQ